MNKRNIIIAVGVLFTCMLLFAGIIGIRNSNLKSYRQKARMDSEAGRYSQAVDDFSYLVARNPADYESYIGRGNAYFHLQQYALSIRDFNTAETLAKRVNGHWKAICFWRAEAYRAEKSYAAAAADYKENIALHPTFYGAYQRYAWFLATCPDPSVRNGALALENAQKSCNDQRYTDLDVLAAAYAAAGRFQNAISTEQQAIQICGNSRTRAIYRSRLALYQANKPYLEE